MSTVRKLIIELNEQGDVVLESLHQQMNVNKTTVIHRAVLRYAVLRGLRDDDGMVTILLPRTGPWWRRRQRARIEL